ncbi:MAG: hypothetical protein P3T54_00090 [Dehalogenimonas sp.]|nr:hypothetical protein [Dehalogenimonas sp.]
MITFWNLLQLMRVCKQVGWSKRDRRLIYYGYRAAAQKANAN